MNIDKLLKEGYELEIQGRKIRLYADVSYGGNLLGELRIDIQFLPIESDFPFVDSDVSSKFNLPIGLVLQKKSWIEKKLQELKDKFLEDVEAVWNVKEGSDELVIEFDIGGEPEKIRSKGYISTQYISANIFIPLTMIAIGEDPDVCIDTVYKFIRPIIVFLVKQIPFLIDELKEIKKRESRFLLSFLNRLKSENEGREDEH